MLARCAGRTITDAVAAVTVLPAVPSATDTWPEKVSTPEIPFGAVETLVASAATPDQRIGVAAQQYRQRVGRADRGLHAVDEHVLEAADVVDRYAMPGGSQRRAHPRVAAEIAANSALRASSSRLRAACSPLT